MPRLSRVTLCVLFALGLCQPSSAQTHPLTLVPSNAPRWDASGAGGWSGRSQTSSSATFREGTWLNAGGFAASLGYYFSPHLKFESELATSSTASFYTFEPLAVPGRSTQTFQSREHGVKTTTVAGRIAYQFFENRWAHPFVTAGVEVVRDRDRIETLVPPLAPASPAQPAIELETRTTNSTRPVVGGGFKFYVAERAFIRTDARVSFGREGVAASSWVAGIGFDF